MFTIAQALTRLTAGQHNLLKTQYGVMSAAQQLQRINEILDRWYEAEDWRGVRSVQALTSVSGIISLPAAYLRADKRIVVTTEGHCGCYFEIKPLEYQFQLDGPGYFDVTEGCCYGVAIDLGDDASGVRRYQLTGEAATLDTYAYKAVLRLRYVYATTTTPVVVPDCYSAIVLSVRAFNAEDEGAYDVANNLWGQVFQMLDDNIGQFEEGNDWGVMPIDPLCAAPNYNAL